MKHKKKEKKRIEDYWIMEVVGSAKAPVKPSVREKGLALEKEGVMKEKL